MVKKTYSTRETIELGSGKTTFVKGLAQGLGESYQGRGEIKFVHVDGYRVGTSIEKLYKVDFKTIDEQTRRISY